MNETFKLGYGLNTIHHKSTSSIENCVNSSSSSCKISISDSFSFGSLNEALCELEMLNKTNWTQIHSKGATTNLDTTSKPKSKQLNSFRSQSFPTSSQHNFKNGSSKYNTFISAHTSTRFMENGNTRKDVIGKSYDCDYVERLCNVHKQYGGTIGRHHRIRPSPYSIYSSSMLKPIYSLCSRSNSLHHFDLDWIPSGNGYYNFSEERGVRRRLSFAQVTPFHSLRSLRSVSSVPGLFDQSSSCGSSGYACMNNTSSLEPSIKEFLPKHFIRKDSLTSVSTCMSITNSTGGAPLLMSRSKSLEDLTTKEIRTKQNGDTHFWGIGNISYPFSRTPSCSPIKRKSCRYFQSNENSTVLCPSHTCHKEDSEDILDSVVSNLLQKLDVSS